MECSRRLDIDQTTLTLLAKTKVQDSNLIECSSLADCGSKIHKKKKVAALCQPDRVCHHEEARARYCTLIYSKRLCYHNDAGK